MSSWSRRVSTAVLFLAASAIHAGAQEAPRSAARDIRDCGTESRSPLNLCPLLARPAQNDAAAPVLHASTAATPRALVSLQEASGRSRAREGAIIGLVVGAGAAIVVLSSGGGSGSLCDKDKDDDAIGMTACAGIVAGAGLTGAGLGALIGSRIRKR